MVRTHGRGDHPPACFGCHVLSVQVQGAPAFQPHFNWSVGRYVQTEAQYKDELKKAGDVASERLGIEHRYEMRLPSDKPTGDIEATRKKLHDDAVALRVKDPTRAA